MATMTNTRTWTVLELINWSKAYLEEKGFDNARLEVELLLSHALDLPRVELYVQFERQLNERELAGFKALFKRRIVGEPVQYITGTAAFMLGEFEVGPAVLIPRPETEALTEVVLKMLADLGAAPVVADIGTGSGVIAVSVAMKVPRAVVYATDVSAAALEVAARNAEKAGVADHVTFLEGELLQPLSGNGLAGGVTALVSNPPYIPTRDLEGLQAEVRDFEPRGALDGGEDGLEFLRLIVQDGPDYLTDGGFMALEVGDGQAEDVAALMRERLADVEVHKDYAGRDRIVTGWKKVE